MPSSPPQAHPKEEVGDAMRFIFEEYNQNKDGFMTRKEFFTFLWELKQSSKQALNEGQMLNCWMAVSQKKEYITFEDFQKGLEICYENYFFARENDAPIPHFKGEDEEDPASYDTLRIKASTAVKAFDAILQEEKKVKETAPPARPMTLYGQTKPKPSPPTSSSSIDRPIPRERYERSERSERSSERLGSTSGSGSDAGLYKNEPTVPVVRNFHTRVDMLQKERELKKIEAQKKMDQILAARYQEQRRQRELQRQQEDEDRRRQSEMEADKMVSEPAWKKDLKANKRNY